MIERSVLERRFWRAHTVEQDTIPKRPDLNHVSADGTANVVHAIAANITPGAPIDSALANDGSFLYVEDSARGNLFFFRVNGNNLAAIGNTGGLPTTLQGIAAQ